MSFRAKVTLVVDVLLGAVLVVLFVTRVQFVFWNRHGGSSHMVHQDYQYAAILIVMGAVTAWWLLGRRRKST